MFFWIGLAVVFVVFVGLVTWGVRGYQGRAHEPGTTHMKPPGLFWRNSVSDASGVAHSLPKMREMPRREPQPPDGPS